MPKKKSAAKPELLKDKIINGAGALRRSSRAAGIIAFGLVVVISVVIYSAVQPKRTPEGFCAVFTKESQALRAKYDARAETMKAQTDPLSSMLVGAGSLAEAQGDYVVLLDKLEKAAPDEIQPEVAATRDAMKKQLDTMGDGISSPFRALASSLVYGMQSQGSYGKVNSYISTHCDTSFMGLGTASTTQTLPDFSSEDVKEGSFHPWDRKQKGIVALYKKSELVLIDPKTFTVIAKRTLPMMRSRTPGGDAGKSYELDISFYLDDSGTLPAMSYLNSSYFSRDFRYTTVTFARDESYNGPPKKEFGYYDLSNNTVGIVPTQGDDASFDAQQNATLIVDYAGAAGNVTTSYAIDTKQVIENVSNVINPSYIARNTWFPSAYDPLYIWNKTHSSLVKLLEPKDSIKIRRGSTEGLGCTPIQMLSDTSHVCLATDGIATQDISTIVQKRTTTDDPSSYNYEVGKKYYDVPEPNVFMSLDTNFYLRGDRVIPSPDSKRICAHDTQYAYCGTIGKNDSKKVASLERGDSLTFLGWLQ